MAIINNILSFLSSVFPPSIRTMVTPLELILLPALATVIGGILVEYISIAEDTLVSIYHFSAGLVMGIIGIELIPQFINHSREWLIIIIYVIGGAAFVLVDWLTDFVPETLGISLKKRSPWTVFIGLTVDLLTDGMLIASGSSLQNLGLPLAVATAVVAFPEAFTSNATFKRRNFGGWQLTGMAVLQAILMILGVPIGYFIVHGRPIIYTYAVIAFTAGFLSVLLAEEVLPRAHRGNPARLSAFLFLVGFAMVAFVSAYVG